MQLAWGVHRKRCTSLFKNPRECCRQPATCICIHIRALFGEVTMLSEDGYDPAVHLSVSDMWPLTTLGSHHNDEASSISGSPKHPPFATGFVLLIRREDVFKPVLGDSISELHVYPDLWDRSRATTLAPG